jgi:hypothetical protein
VSVTELVVESVDQLVAQLVVVSAVEWAVVLATESAAEWVDQLVAQSVVVSAVV